MQRAIRVNEDFSIIVTLKKERETQLTPQGLNPVEVMTAIVYAADGLLPIGAGVSIRQMEDPSDDALGAKLAVGRALRDAGLTREERARAFGVLLKTIKAGQDSAPRSLYELAQRIKRQSGMNVSYDIETGRPYAIANHRRDW